MFYKISDILVVFIISSVVFNSFNYIVISNSFSFNLIVFWVRISLVAFYNFIGNPVDNVYITVVNSTFASSKALRA